MKTSRKKVYNTAADQPFKLSRSKIELFEQCPCCFYLDRKLGFSPPSGPPFTLNNAVDLLWKDEFDKYRALGVAHPIAVANNIEAIPFQHEKIDDWRNNRRGLTFVHEATQLLITGAPDEIWITPKNELIVVDVKATSKQSEISLDADWQISYKRQMEIYQWLLQNNGFNVSERGFFIYCNGKRDERSTGTNLAFDVTVLPYDGDLAWIEPTLHKIKECLSSEHAPASSSSCKLCQYRSSTIQALSSVLLDVV